MSLFGKKDGEITKEKVLAALGHVDDPDLKKDLVTLEYDSRSQNSWK